MPVGGFLGDPCGQHLRPIPTGGVTTVREWGTHRQPCRPGPPRLDRTPRPAARRSWVGAGTPSGIGAAYWTTGRALLARGKPAHGSRCDVYAWKESGLPELLAGLRSSRTSATSASRAGPPAHGSRPADIHRPAEEREPVTRRDRSRRRTDDRSPQELEGPGVLPRTPRLFATRPRQRRSALPIRTLTPTTRSHRELRSRSYFWHSAACLRHITMRTFTVPRERPWEIR